jgi:hypothetical protein
MKNEITLEILYNEFQDIKKYLSSIENKIDELVSKKNIQREKKRISKEKPKPLTEEEISKYKEKFDNLFELWLKGNELQVVQEMEILSPDEIRRFADSNNLNVTSKMSKEKVLNLINIRFREKKMMTSNFNVTKPLKDQL